MAVQEVSSIITSKPSVSFATSAHTEVAFTVWIFQKASNDSLPVFLLIADTTLKVV